MDAQLLVVALGVVVLGAAVVTPRVAPVDTRVLRMGEQWIEAKDVSPPPPPWLVDGAALSWAAPPVACAPEAGDAGAAGGRLHLNTASDAALQALPGIGPALAKRIRDGRPYHRVEDLDRVKGVGPATLARLRPLVRP